MDNFKNKFIVIMEGKVGNSFGCLFYAHKLAKDTKKDFVINSVKNINREASFYDFFSTKNNFQHIEYSITELNNIIPKHIPFLLHKGHYVNSGAIKDREVIYHRSMEYDELIKTINSFDSVCYLDDASAHAMRNPNEIIESAKNLLIHEDILQKVNSFCKEKNITPSVNGIHIRATDWPWKQECINDAYKTIQNIINLDSNSKIFVCCDEEEIENDLIQKLPNNIITNKKNSYVKKAIEGSWRQNTYAGDGRTQDYNTLIDVESAIEAFIDMLILSRTTIKYRHQHSSFSWFSEIYSNVKKLN